MKYALEEIQPDDLEKILKDLSADPEKKKKVIVERILTKAAVKWAVNRSKTSYIFLAPTSREEAINPRFYFFYDNVWYEFYVVALFGNLVHFVDSEPRENELRMAFREDVRSALISLGRYGNGSEDILNSVLAEFKEA